MSTAPHHDVLAQIWAKSATKSNATGESLVAHTATVVSRLERLYGILPGLATRTGEERLWHRAMLACILHDLGKAAAGFQLQLRQPGKPWCHRHEVLSLAFLEWVIGKDNHDDASWIAAGVVSHHRDFDLIETRYPPADDPGDDPFDPVVAIVNEVSQPVVDALAEFIRVDIPEWLATARLPVFDFSPTIPSDPATDFKRNAVARIYRALMLYRRMFRTLEQQASTSPPNLAALAMRGIVLLADHTASAHVTPQAMPLYGLREILERLKLGSDKLYKHQGRAAQADGNLLLSAPTGSGKTESALLWSANQRSNHSDVGRLFYVLPYQASLNAMYDRLTTVFPRLITLQHSRAAQALYRRLLETDRYDSASAARTARFQRSLARLHFHPIRVLTPYQLLRSAFRLRGYESILADAVNGLFIFDEIHAYEPVRLGMILAMVQYLGRQLGGRFIVMSATFPSVMRKLLGEALAETREISAHDELYRKFARHRLQFIAGEIEDSSTLEKVAALAKGGQSVLVVCNTVKRSKRVRHSLAPLLEPCGISPELLHSRFNSRDRFAKERHLAKQMGTKSRSIESPPVVMVATQVVEVSLDIDFDTILTEAAPLEALVQRFGRVNRGRKKPECAVHVLTAPASGQGVYRDALVAAALEVLQSSEGKLLDESKLGNLLDRVYTGEIERQWTAEVQYGRREFVASCLNRLRAFQSDPDLADAFDQLFEGTEVLPQSFESEYERLMEEDSLRAAELLVPIPIHEFKRLQKQGRIHKHPEHDVHIAQVPYTDEGLATDVMDPGSLG